MEETLDRELRVLSTLSRALPRLRGAGRVAVAIGRLYQRKKRNPVIAPVLNFRMRLNPHEAVDSACLFYPQLYDRREIALLRKELRTGDVFLDVGANVGFYALNAAVAVGSAGRVVAIEPDPGTRQILTQNIDLNGLANVEVIDHGISDCHETLRLGINLNGNRGSSSFLAHDQPYGVNVSCVPLSEIVLGRNLSRIAAAKVDIEGFGVKALAQYFQNVPESLFPRLMIVEEEAGLSSLMESHAYRQLGHWGFNRVYQR